MNNRVLTIPDKLWKYIMIDNTIINQLTIITARTISEADTTSGRISNYNKPMVTAHECSG